MHIEGPLDRLLASVLPHEITHTVFAYYFRQPLPRWADEGGAVLSEDDIERNRHDRLVRSILNTPGRAIPLRRLFSLTQYPPDVMVLYAEGYSVSNFLVASSSRQVFLNFVAQGMRGDWDGAVRTNYGYNSVEELEKAWVESLYKARQPQQPAGDLAGRPAEGRPSEQVVMRQTAPPAPPLLEAPRAIVRGQAPDADAYPSDAKGTDAQEWWLPPAPRPQPRCSRRPRRRPAGRRRRSRRRRRCRSTWGAARRRAAGPAAAGRTGGGGQRTLTQGNLRPAPRVSWLPRGAWERGTVTAAPKSG